MTEVTNYNKRIMQVVKEACRIVPKLAFPKEEPVNVCICKLATGVRDPCTEMARVQLKLNLQITEYS